LVQLIKSSRQNLRKKRNQILIAVVLAGVAVGIGFFFWKNAQDAKIKSEQLALARQLGTQSKLSLGATGTSLIQSTLLAVESLRRQPTLEGDLAIRRCLGLLCPELIRLTHDGPVDKVIFSTDGELLAAASANTARLWDRRGRELARLSHEGGFIKAFAFSPDGQVLATTNTFFGWESRGSNKSWPTLKLWDCQGQELFSHEETVQALAFSLDGQVLATASGKEVRLWDRQGRQLAVLNHKDMVRALAFNPNSREPVTLATASDKTVTLWNRNGREVARLPHEQVIRAMAFSTDGKQLAAASGKTVQLWDLRSKKVFPLNHEFEVGEVIFNRDGLMAAASGNEVWVWDSQGQLVIRINTGGARMMRFSPDGQRLATVGSNGTASLWDPGGNELARATHDSAVQDLAFRPDGKVLATASADNTVRLWDLQDRSRPVWITRKKCRRTKYKP
jgi:WD40 repeat protein